MTVDMHLLHQHRAADISKQAGAEGPIEVAQDPYLGEARRVSYRY